MQERDPNGALEAFRAATAADNTSYAGWFGVGTVLSNEVREFAVTEEIGLREGGVSRDDVNRRAIPSDIQSIPTIYHVLTTDSTQGALFDRDGAVAAFEKAVECDCTAAEAWSDLGALVLKADPARGVAALRKAVDLDPAVRIPNSVRLLALLRHFTFSLAPPSCSSVNSRTLS